MSLGKVPTAKLASRTAAAAPLVQAQRRAEMQAQRRERAAEMRDEERRRKHASEVRNTERRRQRAAVRLAQKARQQIEDRKREEEQAILEAERSSRAHLTSLRQQRLDEMLSVILRKALGGYHSASVNLGKEAAQGLLHSGFILDGRTASRAGTLAHLRQVIDLHPTLLSVFKGRIDIESWTRWQFNSIPQLRECLEDFISSIEEAILDPSGLMRSTLSELLESARALRSALEKRRSRASILEEANALCAPPKLTKRTRVAWSSRWKVGTGRKKPFQRTLSSKASGLDDSALCVGYGAFELEGDGDVQENVTKLSELVKAGNMTWLASKTGGQKFMQRLASAILKHARAGKLELELIEIDGEVSIGNGALMAIPFGASALSLLLSETLSKKGYAAIWDKDMGTVIVSWAD